MDPDTCRCSDFVKETPGGHSRGGVDLDQPLDPFHSIQAVITAENDKCRTTGRSQQSAKKEETRTKTRRSAKTLLTMELWFKEELGWVVHHSLEVHHLYTLQLNSFFSTE